METLVSNPLTEYDESIFVESNEATTYLCTICQSICFNVVSVQCGNGHIFCRGCIEQYIKHSNQCPNCKKQIQSIHDAKFVARLIQSLQVHCLSFFIISNKLKNRNQNNNNNNSNHSLIKSLCEWKGSLRECTKHYNHDCDFSLFKCPKCEDVIFRKDIVNHESEICPFSIIECTNQMQGCKQKMTRNKLKEHIDHSCKFRIAHCPYTKFGCNFTKKNGKLGIKGLQKHMKDNEYRILHLEFQLHSLTNANNSNNIVDSNNSNNICSNCMSNGDINNNNSDNLLFAYVGSSDGEYCQRNAILRIDMTKGTSQTILDPLSIALINNTDNRQWDIRNHGSCVAKNAIIDAHNSNKKGTVLFRVGGWNSNDIKETAIPIVDGYIIEQRKWLGNIPELPNPSSGAGCVYSNKYGLFVVGGENPMVTDALYNLPFGISRSDDDDAYMDDVNDDDIVTLSANGEEKSMDNETNDEMIVFADHGNGDERDLYAGLKWKKLAAMKRARTNIAVSSFMDESEREQIFVCGGYKDGESLRFCELYSMDTNVWKDLPKSNYRHQSAGCCYWKQLSDRNGYTNDSSMVVVGGYPEARLVEEYSFYKNKWFKLPSTQHNHQFLPNIWVHNNDRMGSDGSGILLCAGNRCNLKPLIDRTATGYVEFYDKRDSRLKWNTLYSLRDLLYFGLHCKIDSKDDDGRRLRRIFC